MFKILYQRHKSKTKEGPDGKAEARMGTGGPAIKVGIGVESEGPCHLAILGETGGPVIEIETDRGRRPCCQSS